MATRPPRRPEQRARETIDAALVRAGWIVQDRDQLNVGAGPGVAVREFPTDAGPCGYLLLLAGNPAGVIEAKKEGVVLTGIEAQTRDCAGKLPAWMRPPLRPLPFLYESTGVETRFTNLLDPVARSRRVFSVHQPATLQRWLDDGVAIRERRPGAPVAALSRPTPTRAPAERSQDVGGAGPRGFTLKTKRLRREDLDDFVACFRPVNRNDRQPTWSEQNPNGRWRAYEYDELTARDKCSLDLFWLKDESLLDADNLPDPDEIAAEIADDLRSALEQIEEILGDLQLGKTTAPHESS